MRYSSEGGTERSRSVGIGSITYAMKAKALLEASGMIAEVIRLDPAKTPRGCSYGLRVSERNLRAVTAVLEASGIAYSLL